MNKEFNFLVKPRYEYYKGTTEIVDNELDNFVDDVVVRLNEQHSIIKELVEVKQNQDEKIADLQHKLKVTEKALELACVEIGVIEAKFGSAYIRANGYLLDYFKTEAKEMFENE